MEDKTAKDVIDLVKLTEAYEYIAEINEFDLHEVVVIEDGMAWEPDKKKVEEFKFTGLSNRDYFICCFEDQEIT
jgi:hypothetical protein